MAEPIIRIDVTMRPNRARQIIGLERRDVARAVERTTQRLIDMAEEDMSVSKYTQNADPPKPPNSAYIRTFDMKQSVDKNVSSQRLSAVGVLDVGIDYASFVVGPFNDQSIVHRGRWAALETIVTNVENIASSVWDQEIRRFIP